MPLTLLPGGYFSSGLVPWIGLELANAEGDFLLLAIDAEHDRFDFLFGLEHIGRFRDALGPGEFGDMDEAFDTGFDFDEGAVRNEVDDFAFDLRADRILGFDLVPRIGELLLEAEADAFLLAIDVEDDDIEVLTDFEDFGRMTDAAPGHIGDMEETIEAVEVDERTEIGDVLDGAFADVARHHLGEELAALLVAFLLDQFAAGQNDVLALLVDLNDFEFVGVADENVEVLRRGDVDLGGREESFDTDVDEETTFDDGFDFALDGAAFVADGEDVVPVLLELGLFLGEDDHAVFVFELLDEDVDFVTDFDGWTCHRIRWRGQRLRSCSRCRPGLPWVGLR